MNIRFLGHAGFFIECGIDKILCDPWFSTSGAYAASWFPFPDNSTAAQPELEDATHLYISHWHHDHFDEEYLASRSDKFKQSVQIIIAKFAYPKLKEWIELCGYLHVLEIDEEIYLTPNGTTLLIQRDENPLYVDSALTCSSEGVTFLNANDCKLSIAQEEKLLDVFGEIHVFAAQFSGATFHPTCYEYSQEQKIAISKERRVAKFKRIADSISRLKVKKYIPSAGPACFLSDDLFYLNLNHATVFSTANDFSDWFAGQGSDCQIVNLMPGDSISICNEEPTNYNEISSKVETLSYLREYQSRRAYSIKETLDSFRYNAADVLAKAKQHFLDLYELEPKLGGKANVLLQVIITEVEDVSFIFDTFTGEFAETTVESGRQHYRITIDVMWMSALIEKKLSWEDLILSFRFSISRDPDIYNEAFIAFLQLETRKEREDYLLYLQKMDSSEVVRGTRVIDGQIITYDRYCPHNGEDLCNADIENGVLTCPRHFWKFSLLDGSGINNPLSIHVHLENSEDT